MSKPTQKPHWLVRVGAYSFISVVLGVVLGVALLILWAISIWLWGLGTAWQIVVVVAATLLGCLLLALIGGVIQFGRERRENEKEWSR